MIKQIWPDIEPACIWEKLAVRIKKFPGYCLVCGKPTVFRIESSNLRETVVCPRCWSYNRMRQLALVLLSCASGGKLSRRPDLRNIPKDIVLWNAEVKGCVHDVLSKTLKNYICSEFIDPSMKSGEFKDGIMHVDMQNTHFEDNSLDIIVSADVMEHMPRPEMAFRETYRILKPGGYHVFTTPFYINKFTNEKRALTSEHGQIDYLLPPMYHGDPFRPEGILVYNTFGTELLSDLEKIGFNIGWYRVYSPLHGVFGNDGIVLTTQKPANAGTR